MNWMQLRLLRLAALGTLLVLAAQTTDRKRIHQQQEDGLKDSVLDSQGTIDFGAIVDVLSSVRKVRTHRLSLHT